MVSVLPLFALQRHLTLEERSFVRSAAQQFLLVNKILNFTLKIDLFAGKTRLE